MLSVFLLIVAAIFLTFAGMVWRASPDRATNRRFTILAMSVSCWAIGIGGVYSGHYVDFWVRMTFASGAFITVSVLAFVMACAPQRSFLPKRLLEITFCIASIEAVAALTTNLLVYDGRLTVDGLQRTTGPLFPLFAVFVVLPWLTAFVICVAKCRVARGRARAQLLYIGAGIVLPTAGGILTNLVWPMLAPRSTYSWAGPCLCLLFAGVVGHAIIRRRLSDLRLVVHRSLTLTIAIVLSALPAAALLAFLWPRLLVQLDFLELALLLVAVGIATILIPITRDIASRLLDRYVYRTRANYRRTVREASRMLTRVLHLETLLRFISTTVIRSTAVEGVALYLRDNGVFKRAVAEKRSDAEHFDTPAVAAVEIVAALDAAQEPLLADELARERAPEAAALHPRLAAANWALLLPVLSDDGLIAMIAVGPKLSGDG